MLARRTCQRVVDKPTLACTALSATVYRAASSTVSSCIHSRGKRCPSSWPKVPHRSLLEATICVSLLFALVLRVLLQLRERHSQTLPETRGFSLNCVSTLLARETKEIICVILGHVSILDPPRASVNALIDFFFHGGSQERNLKFHHVALATDCGP